MRRKFQFSATMKNFFLSAAILLMLGLSVFAQQKPSNANQQIKSSAAYAEVLLRKAELQAEIESLLESYTEEFPKVKESRYEFGLLQKDIEKLSAQTDVSKLTQALGKLIVRRAELNTNLWVLQNRLGAEHPEVKRAQRKAAGFDSAVKEIMP